MIITGDFNKMKDCHLEAIPKVRHAQWGMGGGAPVSFTKRNMGMRVSWRSVSKMLFCSSSGRYQTDSIDCHASFVVHFN